MADATGGATPGREPGPASGATGEHDAADAAAPEEGTVAEAEQQVQDDLTALQRERDEYLATSQRLQADLENFRKRMMREQTSAIERATEGIVEQLLPVLDSFELAVLQLEADADVDRIRKGVDLVLAELLSVLERAGLERVAETGTPFDPHVHEAVLHEAGAGEPVVSEVMRAGYKVKGRVVRPAMVKVSGSGAGPARDGGSGEDGAGA